MHSGQCGALASVLLGSQADVSSLAQMQLQVMLREKSFPPPHTNHVKLKEEETSLQFAAGGSEGVGEKSLPILWESLRLLFGMMKSSNKLS